MHEQFWKVWTKDYLHSLQQRLKWQQRCSNLSIGDLIKVIVRDDLLPLSKWKLGGIQNLYPDAEGHVRVVDVKTVSGVYKRPITKLCRLPIEQKPDSTVNV